MSGLDDIIMRGTAIGALLLALYVWERGQELERRLNNFRYAFELQERRIARLETKVSTPPASHT